MSDLPSTKATVLISGNGSNLQALIDASQKSLPSLNIVRVISIKKTAFGLERAERASIPTRYHNLVSHGFQAPGEKDQAKKQEAREKYVAELPWLRSSKTSPTL